jgi:hypothetical protein
MASEADFPESAYASPTKRFFVNMLVRDIELRDTLLDLLDNCVDGILRTFEPNLKKPKPYQGYRADIIVSPDRFIIQDNCGGIPIEIAENSAFAIGKPVPIEGDDATATVGMYGIGMKRAIFKLGMNAVVDSWNDRPFRVTISPKWLEDEEWTRLPMKPMPAKELRRGSTRIVVDRLHSEIIAEFSDDYFVNDLIETISQNYAIIIDKGFTVTVRRRANDKLPPPIPPKEFKFLQHPKAKDTDEAIRPYVYYGHIGRVAVEVYAGLYRRLPDTEEQEREEETRGSTDEAGWTVICNDRAVVWRDRTRLTGWGEASVPNFHGQFIAITGVVLLKSPDPKLLPLTTTKRGLDAGSEIYSQIKDMMREATKGLTTFTNRWKKYEDNLEKLYLASEYLDLAELRSKVRLLPTRPYHKIPTIRRFIPKLPTPAAMSTSARVSFLALKTDVALLSLAYYGLPDVKPKEVGEEAFKREVVAYQEAAE